MLKIRRSLTVTVAACVVLSMTGLSASAEGDPPVPPAPAKGGPAVPEPADDVPDLARGLIIKTTTAAPSDGLLAATDKALGSEAEVVDDTRLIEKVTSVDFDQPISGEAAEAVAEQIAERPDVEWATPDRLMRTQAAPPIAPNDQYFGLQRNLWDTVSSPYGGFSIKAPSLWRKTNLLPLAQQQATTVAVIDTGILTGHPDLPPSKLVAGYDMITDSGMARDNQLGRDPNPADEGDWYDAGQCGDPRASNSSWHGTFVAGQIAAATNNGTGIAGVAPNVKIRPVRALGKCGGWTSDILDSMTWASGGAVPGVPANTTPSKIVNMSLSGAPLTANQRTEACRAYSAVASAGNSRGTIFIAAAGNDGANANRVVPGSCNGFISVGATSAKGYSAIYSNIGSTVDLSAPGGDPFVEGASDRILSLGNAGKTAPGAYGYVYEQGTSMAAPQVAGAAALLYSLGFTTPSSLTSALYASVSPFRARSGAYGKKRVGNYVYDLNCKAPGRQWCGRGILDLNQVQAPLTAPVINGTLTIGEPLRTSLGTWVRTPTPKYVWKVAGVVKGTSNVYWPTVGDIGKSITVTIAPTTAAFARLTNTSEATVAVPYGPAVSLSVPGSAPRFGSDYTVRATVQGATSGPVEIRTDSGAVVGRGNVVGGAVNIRVSGKVLKPGSHPLRAAYLGSGATPRASSPRRAVTIRKLTAKVGTKLPRSVSKKKRAVLKITVLERPNLFANPTGQVFVYDGKKRIVTTSLSSKGHGKRTIRLPKLKKGTHKIRVLYRGNDYISSRYSSYRKIKVK